MHICFLDIDGTLVHTGGAGQGAFARALASDFDVPVINPDVLFAGRSDRAITRDLFIHHGIEPTDDNWERFQVAYVRHLEESLPDHRGRVLPGVVELIEALSVRGDVALGLLTGNVREAARRKLTYYGLWDHFPFGGFGDVQMDRNMIAADALAEARLHLEVLRNGDESAGPEDEGKILVIGDTQHDVACGRAIGALCVAVPTGSTPVEVLQAVEPDLLVETLEDVAPILALLDDEANHE